MGRSGIFSPHIFSLKGFFGIKPSSDSTPTIIRYFPQSELTRNVLQGLWYILGKMCVVSAWFGHGRPSCAGCQVAVVAQARGRDFKVFTFEGPGLPAFVKLLDNLRRWAARDAGANQVVVGGRNCLYAAFAVGDGDGSAVPVQHLSML